MRTWLLAIPLLLIGPVSGWMVGPQNEIRPPAFERSLQRIQGASGIWGSAAADLDADGDLDIVLAALTANALVLVNDGRGRFAESAQRISTEMHDIAIGDLDRDGDLDLFFAPIRRQIQPVFINLGRLRFENTPFLVDNSESVQLVDIENDGDLDAYLGKGSVLFLNDGRGGFAKSRLPVPDYSVLVDLDRDRLSDALIAAPGRGFAVRLNDKKGGSIEHHLTPNDALVTCDYDFADLDNDGDLDVIFANALDTRDLASGILLNDGSGRLTDSGQRLSPPVSYGSVGTDDLNGDGFVDLVITDYERPARIWLNAGKGSFIASGIRLGTESGATNVLVRDLDGDGDADVFLPNRRTGKHEVWFNQLREKDGSL